MAMDHFADRSSIPSRGLTPPLVGREAEQVFLRGELTAAIVGRGRLILLAGEAGIGKTTLATDLLAEARARGAAVAIGRCYENGAPAFGPWHELLAELSPAAVAGAPLPPPFGPGAPARTAHQLLRAAASYVHAVAASRPLALLVDDLHWADRDTLDLLEVMTRSLARVPLLLLGTYRPEALQRPRPLFDVLPVLHRDRPITTLHLSNLSADDTRRLVGASHGPCSPELAAYLHGRSDGHPLYLIELLRDLIERRLLPRDEGGRLLPPTHPVQAPKLLQHLIAHRIARLDAGEETLLAVASIVGEEWDLCVVETVLAWEEERLLWALDGALRADVIAPAGDGERYRFRHGLIREILYDAQLARRRKHLHRRVGAALERTPTATVHGRDTALAHHFTAAEEWDEAARYGIAAGDAARGRSAGHSALRLYQQALDALARSSPATRLELQVGLHERLGHAYLVLGAPEMAEGALTAMRESARALDDRAGESRALVWISYVRRRRYQSVGSALAGEDALGIAESLGEPRLLALAHWNLGHLQEIGGDLRRSARHAVEAERLARLSDDPELVGRALQVQAQLALWHGRYHDAERLAAEALTLAHAGHDALALAAAHWRLGLALGELGNYDAARQILLAGVTHAETVGEQYYLAKLLNTVGWLCGELGDAETAGTWNRRALEAVRASHGDRVTEVERYVLLNLAADELAAGSVDVAAAHLDAFAPLLAQDDYGRFRYANRYQLLRAEAALALGDTKTALHAAAEASHLATEKAMPKNLVKSRLLTGRALLAQRRCGEAATELAAAVTMADGLDHGSLRWQGRLWLGQAMISLRQDAAEIFRDAAEQVEHLANGLHDESPRAAFLASPRVRELRAAIAASPPATDRQAGLTTRELDVLRLLTRHQTNKEIAAALFVSPRTVGTHVANILAKLGVANRREAAVAADRLGLD